MICDQVCARHGVPWSWVVGGSRWSSLVRVRREIVWRLVTEMNMGPSEIAMIVDRDHTTVMHHMKLMKLKAPTTEGGDPCQPA